MATERWGTRQRRHLNKKIEAERRDPGTGYHYLESKSSTDYLQSIWANDKVFNVTLHRTFNSNYCTWAACWRENLERGGIRRNAYVRFGPNPSSDNKESGE